MEVKEKDNKLRWFTQNSLCSTDHVDLYEPSTPGKKKMEGKKSPTLCGKGLLQRTTSLYNLGKTHTIYLWWSQHRPIRPHWIVSYALTNLNKVLFSQTQVSSLSFSQALNSAHLQPEPAHSPPCNPSESRWMLGWHTFTPLHRWLFPALSSPPYGRKTLVSDSGHHIPQVPVLSPWQSFFVPYNPGPCPTMTIVPLK